MTVLSRADMHVHSSASEVSRLGIQRSLALPECATPPEEVYELAKRRGMDFVTITDHDTIDGALTISHLPDTFISEELTAWFKDEPCAVHVLCYGITPDDHEWLQTHSGDVEACAEYLHARELATALAHPFYAVAAPLTPWHRRILARLFPIWETRNGSRPKELNLPAFVYIETHGGTPIGGSDDHAGVDIGRTFTETPRVATPEEFLARVRAGDTEARGAQGSAAKWAHAAMALAIRSLGRGPSTGRPDPERVLTIAERVLHEGERRQGPTTHDLGPEDARALLRAWLAAVDPQLDEGRLLRLLQDDEASHANVSRRARRVHERRLAQAAAETIERVDPIAGARMLFDACVPAIPYAAAAAFLGREKQRLTRSDSDRPRVALVADGVGAMHGVTHTLEQIRDRGVPGFEVEVIGTDAEVDRRLSSVAELEIPFYPGLKVGVPSVPGLVEALAEGRYDLVQLCAPGPAGAAALLLARLLELPVIGGYHTELAAYASLRSGQAWVHAFASRAVGSFYGACDLVLSPSPASDERLRSLGIGVGRIERWDRGVDIDRFSPARRETGLLGGAVNVLYAGRIASEKGIELLADAFLAARDRDERLHLAVAGGGPEELALRARLGEHATFLGWLDREQLARAYASADVFMFPSQTDTFGQVVLEAQASGLPVIAVDAGGPASLIDHGRTGLLVPADADSLASALLTLARRPPLRRQLSRGALGAVRGRTWEAALERLGGAYRLVLERASAGGVKRAA
jgi:glycosyltransferase involved in cell wall biosynthesis/predicted metal-dependent phosphoesterase TrpH